MSDPGHMTSQYAEALANAEEVIGGKEAAEHWMSSRVAGLDGPHSIGSALAPKRPMPSNEIIGSQEVAELLRCTPEHVEELARAGELPARPRIERDYQDLKQDLGLGQYEGRGVDAAFIITPVLALPPTASS